MNALIKNKFKLSSRFVSTTSARNENYSCKLLIVGGGAGGNTIASKFAGKLKANEIIVIEPSERHYYQPLFTLIGGGIKTLKDSYKLTENLLPSKVKWLKDEAQSFWPKDSEVMTKNGDTIKYEFMVIAVGLQLNYNNIPGALEALEDPSSGVCSVYSPLYVENTFKVLKNFKSGNAIFTFPNTPVKCPGAPQKICYIVEDYLKKHKKKQNANIIYNTSLPVIFGVKRYADALWKVVNERNIAVNLNLNLVHVSSYKKEAVFRRIDDPDQFFSFEYSMLHITPPQGPPDAVKQCRELTNNAGFVNVNKDTLQHVSYSNIFGIGDCTSSPNSKTAAAVAVQSGVVYANLWAAMSGRPIEGKYDGYASCPLVTGYNKCILAEFDYNLKPKETLPFRQDRELLFAYFLKKDIMPHLYWHLMLKGYWNGPEIYRKIMHLDFA